MTTKIWEMYKESPRGKDLIALFSPDTEDMYQRAMEILKFSLVVNTHIQIEGASKYIDSLCSEESPLQLIPDEITREGWEYYITGSYDTSDSPEFNNNDYREFASIIHLESIVMYLYHDFFKPILYPNRFDIIQRNCNAVGINLPPIPRTNSYKEYLMYYYDICEAINEYQKENQMTDAEVCACIYGCAEMFVDDKDEVSEMPRPINVWFTGASKRDYELLENGDVSEHIWACNERTRRGDIVVIYCTSPYSYIHSIWRASSEGIFNPFDYYHCRTLVSNGIKIPKITFQDLRTHPYFSKVPIVRRNLQGINGIELSSKDYTELLNFIEAKGGDVSELPKLFEKSADLDVELNIEKDVEEKLLIPLLDKLGYKSSDWSRQLSQKAGRNMKAIPDFVFFPKGKEHYQNAPFLIEAKYDMSSIRAIKEAFGQAVSYSRMMQCKVMGICDKERLILYKLTSSGAWDQSKPIFENHWEVINNDADVYAALRKIMAPEIIKSL